MDIKESANGLLRESADRDRDFEARALENVTVKIPAGRFVAIVRPSGSGKTTLLNLIAGIDHPTSSELRSQEITEMKERELARCARHTRDVGRASTERSMGKHKTR